MKRILAAVTSLAALLGVALVTLTFTAPAAEAATVPHATNGALVTKRLVAAIKALPRKPETPRGYARTKFKHWTDANHDCQSTRTEVLAQESRSRVTGHCTITRGSWRSYYDNKTVKVASNLDVDHMVPLKEAWDSGAKGWSANRRTAYANDLADKRTLVAVTASTNRSKGERDPGQWLPHYGRCRYVTEWTAVKIRWGLKLEWRERRALLKQASKCANTVIRVRRAVVSGGSGGTGTGTGSGGGGSTSGQTDPRFQYCYQATDHGYGPYVRGRDPEYAWYTDSDNDGRVCE